MVAVGGVCIPSAPGDPPGVSAGSAPVRPSSAGGKASLHRRFLSCFSCGLGCERGTSLISGLVVAHPECLSRLITGEARCGVGATRELFHALFGRGPAQLAPKRATPAGIGECSRWLTVCAKHVKGVVVGVGCTSTSHLGARRCMAASRVWLGLIAVRPPGGGGTRSCGSSVAPLASPLTARHATPRNRVRR